MNHTIETDDQPGREQRTWGMLCHLSAFGGVIIPFGNIIGPLVVWLIKKDEMPFVDDQGKESLNFQLTMLIAFIVSGILTLVIIGFLLLFVLAVFYLIILIIASINANDGVRYRYPFAIRFIN